MIKNHLRIAFRNILKSRVFFFINLSGLAVAMTASLLILIYVRFEYSYDKFNKKADRIYRVVCDTYQLDQLISDYQTPTPLANALKAEFSGVQEVTRVFPADVLITRNNIKFQEQHSLWADGSLFSIFDFPFLFGDSKTALTGPRAVVFSETAARKYFGNTNPVGQTVLLMGIKLPVTVTGVMKDIPANSHLKADMLISMATYFQDIQPSLEHDWTYSVFYTYMLLKPGVEIERIKPMLPDFIRKYSGLDLQKAHEHLKVFMEPLEKVYMASDRGAPEHGSLNNVHMLTMVAIFLLLIAVVNFVNLSTARSLERAKEVGVRKVLGAIKGQLIWQFLIESLVVSLSAWVIALILFYLTMPAFTALAGKTMTGFTKDYPIYSGIMFLFSLAVGLLAGMYPAYVLSDFKPVSVLSGRFSLGNRGIMLRKSLVIFQFTTSIALIIATLVVFSQLNYLRSKPLGFEKSNLLVLNLNEHKRIEALQERIAGMPGIKSSTIATSIPGRDFNSSITWILHLMNNQGIMQQMSLYAYDVDVNFLNVFGMQLVAGRNFKTSFPGDSIKAMIVNETAVKALGYGSAQDAIGKPFLQDDTKGTIIGVVKDFNFHSLKEAVKPICLQIGSMNYGSLLTLKIDPKTMPDVLKRLKGKWNEVLPDRPFLYYLLKENLDNQYQPESQFGALFFCLALLAIFISCLGLLALASYSTLQRTKEIGIRKVLGASVLAIFTLLTKDFLILIAISFLIAAPLSGLLMNDWLNRYPYRVSIGLWIFAFSGLAAIIIALITLSFNIFKAAVRNPVESLKS